MPDDRIPPRLSARLVKATEWADALDLAVLKVDFTKVPADVQALLVDQTEPNSSLNSPVMIIGNNDFRQTTGKVISSSQNQLTLDFQLEDGNSGSPVLNSKNQVIGVIYRRDSKNGKSLAIPIDSVIQKLREWKIPLP